MATGLFAGGETLRNAALADWTVTRRELRRATRPEGRSELLGLASRPRSHIHQALRLASEAALVNPGFVVYVRRKIRSKPQRLLIYGSSVALAAGSVLMPNGALADAVMPHRAAAPTMASGINIPAADWAEVTDTPSGITVRLPGEVEVIESDEPPCRDYSAVTTDEKVVLLFTVCDFQETPKMSDLHEAAEGTISAFREESGDAAIKSSTRETKFDGRPTLDLRLSVKEGDPDSIIGAYRYIADDSHFIMAQTVSDAQNEKSLNSTHKQLITEIHIPD
ncbi:hypothetical protein AB0F25_09165 [Streptomyces wedmorensis]|uniref:hypothetical protein n=1 Tax=Streptomyces wedmorensis TaxID=43759 RepID=UPI003438B961